MIYGSIGSACSHVDWTDNSHHPRHRLRRSGGHLRLYLLHEDQTKSPPSTQRSRDRTATTRRRWRRKQSWRRRRRRWRRSATGNIHAPISLPEVILPQSSSTTAGASISRPEVGARINSRAASLPAKFRTSAFGRPIQTLLLSLLLDPILERVHWQIKEVDKDFYLL